jgi:hypothetical protein
MMRKSYIIVGVLIALSASQALADWNPAQNHTQADYVARCKELGWDATNPGACDTRISAAMIKFCGSDSKDCPQMDSDMADKPKTRHSDAEYVKTCEDRGMGNNGIPCSQLVSIMKMQFCSSDGSVCPGLENALYGK